MNRLSYAAAAAVLTLALAAGAPALAHHSFAMFDYTKTITVSGTVKEFQYTNPHSWLILVAPGPDGKPAEWAFESEGPSTLLRLGVKRSMFAAGDKVTVQAWPMRDGRPAGALVSATRPGGQTIHFRSGPPPAGVATGG